ncbi:FHA domain-containing protein [Wenzhouxiangella sediminis]|uniref:histidine kinase n=1 Tax=Wenzhouxiangella sediminis TaxID=1792836 RepID=A0A3E1K9D9_9GAMM|nr:FHA domain-containing protein [Wenzhouxiangella sediminis]RFF30773.1 FHA domain-containing protein [Wenzhouxiangella sediminis]
MRQLKPAWQLIQVAGPRVDIPQLVSLTIGRGLEADVILPEPTISRRHVRLELGPEALLEDLGGPLGTLVNGERVGRARLAAGDLITIGSWQFALADEANSARHDEEITVASLQTSLALPRLELLLSFCSRINTLDRPQEIAACLLKTACAGTGFRRAWLLERSEGTLHALASLPEGSDTAEVSRRLLASARADRVACLDHIGQAQASESVIAKRITAALVATIAQHSGEMLLYLDARHEEAPPQPDAARFCQALIQTASLAFARLEHERSLWQQREQIYQDLHDDLGARLLNLIYQAPDAAMADEARAMLVDLRDVVSRPARAELPLDALLAQMRSEAAQRAQGSGASFKWSDPGADSSILWSGRTASLLSRCLRELTTNALKHARPSRIDFDWRMTSSRLGLELKHDGEVSDPQAWRPGRGMANIRKRCRQLGGSVAWRLDGKEIQASLDLPRNPAP